MPPRRWFFDPVCDAGNRGSTRTTSTAEAQLNVETIRVTKNQLYNPFGLPGEG
jgi:hypothetical protein